MLKNYGKSCSKNTMPQAQNSNNSNISRNSASSSRGAVSPVCIYCNISFPETSDLREHCQTEAHERVIMSDEGHDWKWRAPPRGFKSDDYVLCDNMKVHGHCRFGLQCVEAHNLEELSEWKERFHYREMKLQRAKEKELYGKSYTEELLEKWSQTTNINDIIKESIEDIQVEVSSPLITTVSSKNSVHEWCFFITTKRSLKAVALLQDTYRSHFCITDIKYKNHSLKIKNNQEWLSYETTEQFSELVEYQIKVSFNTNIFGTFRQTVVFDFGLYPVLVKNIFVDVVPIDDVEKLSEIRREITLLVSERWTPSNSNIVKFSSTLVAHLYDDWENTLLETYRCPQMDTFNISHETVLENRITKNNYRARMHELLYIEEIERYNLIAQYNLSTKLQIAHSYLLSPNNMAASTVKYSCNGELFALIELNKELSEDTSEGRLILMNCSTVYLCPLPLKSNQKIVYEAYIEDKGRNVIYLRLSAQTVKDLALKPDDTLEVHIQFQLNRLPYCELHYTLDKISSFGIIFPETFVEPVIPWSPQKQWNNILDQNLNSRQRDAIRIFTAPLDVVLPPVLIIGPFGTGKTFTFAQGVKELIKESDTRILLCTHSNSAADLYIKEYFHPLVESGEVDARPLRIYYKKRWVKTIHPIVQKYCLIESTNFGMNVRMPNKEDIKKHKIIVVTLSTSICLSMIGIKRGFFTHILIDEAAQSLECETIIPLILATNKTRVVLAGDHMQLGPDVFSSFAKERGMHISLLERLYDYYPSEFPCKILLCENYRSHEAIIDFTSGSFYDQKLIASRKETSHSQFYPLTFFTTRGEDVQDKNSTAFYNNSEVYEVVERITELKRSWPKSWGKFNEQSVGVVTPYSDQVFRIRSELKKRSLEKVCVERVLNIQGKQFRAIILSTVRTRKTCTVHKDDNEADFGFLSNLKLLNTAITRAQSLVAVIGDPVALCSVGKCSKVWGKFIQICRDHSSLFGMTWTELKCHLDGIELKKIYNLNPLAPEFIPRKRMNAQFYNTQINPNYVHNYYALHDSRSPFNQHSTNVCHTALTTNHFIASPEVNVTPHLVHQPEINLPAGQYPLPVVIAHPVHTFDAMYNPLAYHNFYRLTREKENNSQQSVNQDAFTKHHIPTQENYEKKELIQLMNNVHLPNSNCFNEFINLLPQDLTLADMLMLPIHFQESWYYHLIEVKGRDAAEKFKYLIQTANTKGANCSERLTDLQFTSSANNSPTFKWFDSPSSQINIHKPIYLKEDISAMTNASRLYQRTASFDQQLKTNAFLQRMGYGKQDGNNLQNVTEHRNNLCVGVNEANRSKIFQAPYQGSLSHTNVNSVQPVV